jgi:four helix bundle protein
LVVGSDVNLEHVMKKNPAVKNCRELEVDKACFHFQQTVFQLSPKFPKEETYALTGQLRRSSRSVGASLVEAWAKRRCQAHFISKLTDSDGELQESIHWLRTSVACAHLTQNLCTEAVSLAEEIGRMLGGMINNFKSFCAPV